MNIAFSELCLIGGSVEENVDRLIAAGASQVELMLDGPGWGDFHLNMDSMVRMLRQKPVTYAVHTPVWDINLTSENPHVRQAVLETYRQSIVFAYRLGARHVVLHPGFCYSPTFPKEVARRRCREAILSLAEFNRDYGMQLLVENVGNTDTSIFTQEEYAHFLDDMPSQVGYIIDLGHALTTGWDIPGLIGQLGGRLYALHVHDNNGKQDSHLPIGEGIMEWDRVFAAVAANNKDMTLILEYNIGIPLEKLTQGQEIIKKALE